MFWTKKLLLSVIFAYRRCISPFLPSSCRFYPSCSQYAAGAVDRYGVVRGLFLTLKRLARCHPWHPGGFDPVPERESAEKRQDVPVQKENQKRTVAT
jgi:uncharacterized protein